MNEPRDHLDMIFKSMEGFANGGKLDASELAEIIAIAERDGQYDQNEIRVLRSIISRIKPEEVDDEIRAQLAKISARIGAAAS
ncbi:MAG: hypothetical protein KDI71_06865 [Xanthomonadales bacterium]|nr:hypothetical protein [Xanthomonadales bacterium]